jgi:hypothetical protein
MCPPSQAQCAQSSSMLRTDVASVYNRVQSAPCVQCTCGVDFTHAVLGQHAVCGESAVCSKHTIAFDTAPHIGAALCYVQCHVDRLCIKCWGQALLQPALVLAHGPWRPVF